MWVKASGTSLGSIIAENFVRMDRSLLDAIWAKSYPAETDAREAAAKEDLLAARAPGEEEKRPTVESLLHALFPHRIVYHSHPTLGGGLLCSVDGEGEARRLFGDDMLWIPIVNAGYVLAKRLREEVDAYRAGNGGRWPRFVLMQNHGIVVAGETSREIVALHEEFEGRMIEAIGGERASLFSQWAPNADAAAVNASGPIRTALVDAAEAVATLAAYGGDDAPVVLHDADPLFSPFLDSRDSFAPLHGALTPDHIVYAGHLPAWADDASDLDEVMSRYRSDHGSDPKIVALRGVGVVAIGKNRKTAESALLLFRDAAKIATLAPAFGGVQFMPPDQVDFIRNWEVEHFRARVGE